MTYRIVSDSSSDLLSLDDARYACVPMKIVTDQREYVDNESLDVDGMIADLAGQKGRVGSSCANVQDWLSAFQGADTVLAVTITSALSGSYAAAVQACREFTETHPGAKAYTVDSLATGPGMQLLIEKLLNLARRNLPFEEIVSGIEAYKKHTHLLFALQCLKNLVRNGRVSPAVATMSGLLGIRVVGCASDQGTFQPLCKCRGKKRTLRALTENLKKNGYAGGKIRIGHCQNPAEATALGNMLREEQEGAWKGADIKITACRGLCSFYSESGGLLLAFEDKEAIPW